MIVRVCEGAHLHPELASILSQWGARIEAYGDLKEDAESVAEESFILRPEGLSLVAPRDSGAQELHLDFLNDKSRYWRKGFRGKNEVLAKAMGARREPHPKVFDLTAGLAVDSLTLVRLGFQVVAYERNQALYLLLKDAHLRALSHEKFAENFRRIEFHCADASAALRELSPREPAPILYIDPMFADEGRRAKPKGDLQLLKNLVGDDIDSDRLFEQAFMTRCQRLVLKRHLKARPYQSPDLQIEGKGYRFDIYNRNPS